jgi:hypothetical protein
MTTIIATYPKRHTTGESRWDLNQLGINLNDVEDYEIKWDRLTVYFKDEDREEEQYSPTSAVAVFDEDNGHEWIKHPVKILEAAE